MSCAKITVCKMRHRISCRLYYVFGIFIIPSFLFYISLSNHIKNFYTSDSSEAIGYYVSKDQDHIVFNDTNLLLRIPKFGCDYETQLLIGVRIAASDRIQRDMIRSTWGNRTNFNFTTKLMFLLARDKVIENSGFYDPFNGSLIFMDSYFMGHYGAPNFYGSLWASIGPFYGSYEPLLVYGFIFRNLGSLLWPLFMGFSLETKRIPRNLV